MPGKLTIRKIAAELSLSRSTVHRALSGHPNVRPETRRKVLQTALKNGYALPGHEGRNIAVIVPTFDFSGYLGRLLPRLETEFHRRGFKIQLIPKPDIALLGNYMIDGIVSVVWEKGLEKLLPQDFAIPILTLNAASNTLENIPRIMSDPHGIWQALEYLRNRGCRKILYLSTPDTANVPDAAERLAEFRKFCLKTGQDYDTLHLEIGGDGLEKILPRVLNAEPDACFCASETFAVKVGALLKAAGKRIPDDISLMGLEDGYANEIFTPPITAIRQNFEQIAATAAAQIVSACQDKIPPQGSLIPFTLIERESVRKPEHK